MGLGEVVDDLVEADGGKIGELHFDNGAGAFDRRAHRQPDDGVLAERCVHDASGKFGGQVFRRLEGPAKSPDVLPVDEDARVIGQRFLLRSADGFEVGDAHSSSKS